MPPTSPPTGHPTGPPTPTFGAVVLAGGTAARLGGADKASIELHGRTLLTHALDAVLDAGEVVVLGDWVPTHRPVTFTREDPAHGGPAAGLLAGLDAFARRPLQIAVLAVDMPYVTMATIGRLREHSAGHDGAVLRGADGRRQLAMVLDTARLAQVRPEYAAEHGLPMHRLLAPLDLVEVPALGRESRDVDGWADLRELREDGSST
ncbi:molybdenum cofactor guanylyltransferase [Nocardioides donggukensis]|uniref:NTP transferase domain-containing protein n=1 Tax=Nocardioides donggukensis TaxID=2774019 RepID=A0A927K2A2_9ACTN|nr:NTP transferase domain-containing protein [Nocardioides donggukensis]MBD8868113.1 NTP transferase domain-containing protein [Nocardioides donggukensis]